MIRLQKNHYKILEYNMSDGEGERCLSIPNLTLPVVWVSTSYIVPFILLKGDEPGKYSI